MKEKFKRLKFNISKKMKITWFHSLVLIRIKMKSICFTTLWYNNLNAH